MALTQKQTYGTFTTLNVSFLQSLTSSATAAWKSQLISNLTDNALDYEVFCVFTAAATTATGSKCVSVYACPASYNGTAWVFSDAGTVTMPTDGDAAYTVDTNVGNLKPATVLAYTTSGQNIQGGFVLSNVVGPTIPDGFSLVVVNNTGATFSTGCVIGYREIFNTIS